MVNSVYLKFPQPIMVSAARLIRPTNSPEPKDIQFTAMENRRAADPHAEEGSFAQ